MNLNKFGSKQANLLGCSFIW